MLRLLDAVLPGVEVYVSRADFLSRNRVEAPPYDPNLPVQCWRDVNPMIEGSVPGVVYPGNNPYRGRHYNLVVREQVLAPSGVLIFGQAVLESTFVPRALASRVNLPPDQSGIVVDTNCFPIRDLTPTEMIYSNPWGVYIGDKV